MHQQLLQVVQKSYLGSAIMAISGVRLRDLELTTNLVVPTVWAIKSLKMRQTLQHCFQKLQNKQTAGIQLK